METKITTMERYTEVEKINCTHTEIKIGVHIGIYPNYVANQYNSVDAKRRYLIKSSCPVFPDNSK